MDENTVLPNSWQSLGELDFFFKISVKSRFISNQINQTLYGEFSWVENLPGLLIFHSKTWDKHNLCVTMISHEKHFMTTMILSRHLKS